MIFLLSDSISAREECRLVTAVDQPLEFNQRWKIDARCSHGHAGARHRIDHPSSDHNNDAYRT
jgi:hypothetical protein